MQKIDVSGLSPNQTEYVASLEKTVEEQQIRINQLTEMLAKMQKALYGRSSEKSRYVLGEESDQISLFNEAEAETNNKSEEPAAQTVVAPHTRKPKRTKEELAETVPVVEVICDLDENKCICDICDSELRYLGKEHVRDELEIIPAQVRVLRYIRFNHEGRANNTMAHECVHWYIHRHYFDLLHKKVDNADIAFRCPARISDGDEATQDEERMEKQARGVAPRILMPKVATKKKLQEIFEMHGYRDDMDNRFGVLTEIIDELAAFFHVSKQSAKYRMVDLGFLSLDDAKEIYPYERNPAIWDFAEHPLTVKTTSRPLTRHISHEHAFSEFSKNDGFRELLQSGMFRYVDNAFVINDPKYVQRTEDGIYKLTPYAINHPQECTLLFKYTVSVTIDPSKYQSSMIGFLTRVETDYKKLPRYYPNVQNDTVYDNAKAKEQALQKAFQNVREEFGEFMTSRQAVAPAISFWERVEQIREAKGFSKNKFKNLSGLDDQTVSRLGKGGTVTTRTGIAACFGLDLDVSEAKELLSLAKLALGKDKESLAYEYVLSTFQGCSLDERNDVLQTLGVEHIGVRSKDK